MGAVRRKASQPKEITRELVRDWEARWPALFALNQETLDKERGFVLTKEDAVRIAGGEKQFRKVLERWKQCILWLKGVTVEYDHAQKGYRWIEVETHLTTRHERIMSTQERKHRAESLRLALIRDIDIMTDHMRSMRVLLMNQHSDDAGKINAQREAARIALKQPETLPRIVGGT